MGCNSADWGEEGSVDGSAEEEEFPADLLDELFCFGVDGGGIVFILGELLFCAVFDGGVGKRLILWFSFDVPKLF